AGNSISGRRALFAGLFAVSMAALIALAAVALSPAGFSALDIVLIILFAITLPWMVAKFWNALIGFLILATIHGNVIANKMISTISSALKPAGDNATAA